MNRVFGPLFFVIGIFAISGGLYTWGNGNIFSQRELIKVLIPWADIMLTGPLSIISGYGIFKNRNWGKILGLCTSAVYVFGSILVFICIYWNKDYSVCLIVPSFTGFSIGLSFIIFELALQKSK